MELKMIENILNKYVIEAPSMGRSVILADRIDEVAEDIRQFLLQQCSVSGRSEQVCHICGGENGHTIECTSWCGNTVTV